MVPNLATRKRLEKWQGGQAGVVVAAGTRTQQHLDTTTGGGHSQETVSSVTA